MFAVKAGTASTEEILHSFAGRPDGDSPYGSLILDAAGNLFGTTCRGGTGNYGTAFQLTPEGQVTVLASFAMSPYGNYGYGNTPYAGLVRDSSGNLYGTIWGAVLTTSARYSRSRSARSEDASSNSTKRRLIIPPDV